MENKISKWSAPGEPPVFYREGSSDAYLVQRNLIDGNPEYSFLDLDPKMIWDVGANIGVQSVLMSRRWPNAIIHAFEPNPDNIEILRMNVLAYENVVVHPYALGRFKEDLKLYDSSDKPNFGGCTLHGHKDQSFHVVPVVPACEVATACQEPIDLLKMDCEGSEFPVLLALGDRVAKIPQIVGEIHPQFANGYAVLELLEKTHHLAFGRNLFDGVFQFSALRRDLA